MEANNYILDILSSLTPYLLLLATFVFLTFSIWVVSHYELHQLNFFTFSGFLLGVVSLLAWSQLFSYWGLLSYPKVTHASSGQSAYNIGFLNKLYSNTDYPEIDSALEKSNLDFVSFAELKQSDIPQINGLKSYPYSLVQPSRDDSNIALFSKIPLVLNQEASIPYVLASLTTINNKQYYIFVVHLSPPINNEWLKERNDEMGQLAKYIKSLGNQENVIILGDFNTSVWSPSYKGLISEIPNLKNTSQNQGPIFTWHDHFLQTQIDHIFIPKSATVLNFKSSLISGSDHNMVTSKIKF